MACPPEDCGGIHGYYNLLSILENPKDAKAYFNRGVAYYNQSYSSSSFKALSDFNKAIEINPNFADAFLYRGYVISDARDLDEAISDFNKALELNPKNAEGFYFRGNIKNRLGDKLGANKDWNVASKLGYTKAYEQIKKFSN